MVYLSSDDELDLVFHALSDRTRRHILSRLAHEEIVISELARMYDITLAAVSKHIKVLERAKLVVTSKEGRVHRCAMRIEPLDQASDQIEFYKRFWTKQLDGLDGYVQQIKKETTTEKVMEKKTINLIQEYDAPAAIVFEAIRQGALFKATGVKEKTFTHDFRVGGQYSLEWKSKGSCSGQYTEIVPNQLISFTWTSDNCDSATRSQTQVTVTITERGGISILQLVHDGLPAGFCFEDHLKGWTESLHDFTAFVVPSNAVHA